GRPQGHADDRRPLRGHQRRNTPVDAASGVREADREEPRAPVTPVSNHLPAAREVGTQADQRLDIEGRHVGGSYIAWACSLERGENTETISTQSSRRTRGERGGFDAAPRSGGDRPRESEDEPVGFASGSSSDSLSLPPGPALPAWAASNHSAI